MEADSSGVGVLVVKHDQRVLDVYNHIIQLEDDATLIVLRRN